MTQPQAQAQQRPTYADLIAEINSLVPEYRILVWDLYCKQGLDEAIAFVRTHQGESNVMQAHRDF